MRSIYCGRWDVENLRLGGGSLTASLIYMQYTGIQLVSPYLYMDKYDTHGMFQSLSVPPT